MKDILPVPDRVSDSSTGDFERARFYKTLLLLFSTLLVASCALPGIKTEVPDQTYTVVPSTVAPSASLVTPSPSTFVPTAVWMPPISTIPAPDGVSTPDSQAISNNNGENLVKIVTLSSPYAATFDLAWSLDGEVFAVASSLATRWYRADTLEELGSVKGQYVPSSVALRPDGRAVALGIARTIEVRDVENGNLLRKFETLADEILALNFSPDGRTLAATLEKHTSSCYHSAQLWDLSTGHLLHSFTQLCGLGRFAFFQVAFRRDGRLLAFSEEGPVLFVWDATTDALLAEFTGHTGDILDVALNPDDSLFAAVSKDGELWFGRVEDDQSWVSARHDRCRGTVVAFSPDGRSLVAGGDNVLCFWDVEARRLIHVIEDGGGRKRELLFNPDGRMLVSSSQAGAVLWASLPSAIPSGVQTAVAAMQAAFPVQGSVLVAGGRWMGGPAGQPVSIPVAFEAKSPFAEVTEMRTAEKLLTDEEMKTIPWEPFATTRTFTFTPPVANWFTFGVSVQFRDAIGNLSPVYYHSTGVEGMYEP